ncbi:hypothetical protein GCM10023075_82490 [Streptosporangium album]
MNTSLKGSPAQIWRIWAGCGVSLILAQGSGNFRVGTWMSVWEAMRKVCGVLMAMPQG